jgi:leucyl aminopeptidase
MEFTVSTINQLPEQTPCLIIGVFTEKQLSSLAEQIDKANNGVISAFLEQGDLNGKVGQTAWLYKLNGAERVLIVGCGDKKGISQQDFYKILRSVASALKLTRTNNAIFALPALKVNEYHSRWQLRQAVVTLRDELYSFTQLKSKPDTTNENLSHIDFLITPENKKLADEALNIGTAIADGVKLAKDLAYLPANICTPTYLAEKAQQVAKELNTLKVEVLEEKDLRELKMGSLLSVTKGSLQPPKFVIIRYQGAEDSVKPIVFVGKGITFDTGGISLKAMPNIIGMKFDMCGAASVLATLQAAAFLKLPLNIIGIMVCVENMIGPDATRPDDVVTSMSGQTIEINNTDAEGRLILCDALTYSTRFHPDVVIDMATLTGAIITALGKHASGLFSNDQTLADALLTAGQESGDRVWQLPIWDEYQSQLDSNVADMVNSATSGANSITAACFLSKFTKEYPWAHLDIAGTAFQTSPKGTATGRPVHLLVQYLLDRC